MTRIAPLADVKSRLSAYIEESQTEGPVITTRNGKARPLRSWCLPLAMMM
jgi:hypothetical protein